MKNGCESVVFGHMHEDHSLELALVGSMPTRNAVVIASGGDLALSLAGMKVRVMAVDSNPAQIELIRRKIKAAIEHSPEKSSRFFLGCREAPGLCFCGKVDRIFRCAGRLLAGIYQGRWHRWLIPVMLPLLKCLVVMVHGRNAGQRLTPRSVDLMRFRFETALRDRDAEINPYLQVLLGNGFGERPPFVWTVAGISWWRHEASHVTLIEDDVSKYLSNAKPNTLGLISLSNLYDVLDEEKWNALYEKAHEALTPGGFLVVRSMTARVLVKMPTKRFQDLPLPEKDLSPLCPVIWVGKKV